MGKKVIAAGHICIDITPAFPSRKVQSVSDILAPGKLIEVGAADAHTGGSVANTGLAMKIFGADVSLMGKIGDDAFGGMIRNVLEKYDAAGDMIVSENESSSYSVVLAIPGIDRMFLHNPGANNTFTADDIPSKKLAEAALFHFGYPPLMRSMYENDGAELERLMKRAHDAGCATSLDLAAVDEHSPAGQVDWDKILRRTLPYVDFFVPSFEELCFMLDRENFRRLIREADGRDITDVLDVEQDVVLLAEKCLAYGAKTVLVKCGAPGMYLRTSDESTLGQISPRLGIDSRAWADQNRFERSYVPDRILSGTGAGDTAIAAYLTAILDGYGPDDALHLAAAEGASSITEYDALSGLLSFEDALAKIRGGWQKA